MAVEGRIRRDGDDGMSLAERASPCCGGCDVWLTPVDEERRNVGLEVAATLAP